MIVIVLFSNSCDRILSGLLTPKMAPFPNEYNCRRVAANDSKACAVCYKPTLTVLITTNQVDFFYTCENHLSDGLFASATRPAEYQTLVKNKIDLESKIDKATQEKYKHKPLVLSKVWNLEKKDDQPDKYGELLKQLTELQEQLATANTDISGYKFTQYQLDNSMYTVRLNHHRQAQAAKARKTKIELSGFFPSAPTHNIK